MLARKCERAKCCEHTPRFDDSAVAIAILYMSPFVGLAFNMPTNAQNLRPTLIAEEVAEVNPELVVHDEKGEIYRALRPGNAMLLNEFLKEHRAFIKSSSKWRNNKEIDALREELKEQRYLIQKVVTR